MADMEVALVATDRPLWNGRAKIVVATTAEGDIGIMAGHEPLLALLVDGLVRIETPDSGTVTAVVHEGFLSVSATKVTILAETAELDTEIDVVRAQRALDRIMADGTVDRHEKDAERRARSRLKAAMAAEGKAMTSRQH